MLRETLLVALALATKTQDYSQETTGILYLKKQVLVRQLFKAC